MILKRGFDLVILITLVPFWVPVIVVVAVLIRLKLGSPVLFTQRRLGYRGREFTLVKFRTMIPLSGGNALPDADEQRLTPFGRWLRSTSLDELPELWNILKGEMSLVGPRPLIASYAERYSKEQMRRHDVLPGLTGLAQVRGRNVHSWDERFRCDLEYVDRYSFWLDLTILAKTFQNVVFRKDISAPGRETMPEFKGESPPRE